MESKLELMGGVTGLGFGFYGEASKEVHALLDDVAEEMAERFLDLYALSGGLKQAKAMAKRCIRRKWALTCAFGWSALKLEVLRRIRRGAPFRGVTAQAWQETHRALENEQLVSGIHRLNFGSSTPRD